MDGWAAQVDLIAAFDGGDAEVGLFAGCGFGFLVDLAEDAIMGDGGKVGLEAEFLGDPVAEFFGPEGERSGRDLGVALVGRGEPDFGLAGEGQERVVEWRHLDLPNSSVTGGGNGFGSL